MDRRKALKSMGADITQDAKGRIIIEGKSELGGMEHTVAADRIQTGTSIPTSPSKIKTSAGPTCWKRTSCTAPGT